MEDVEEEERKNRVRPMTYVDGGEKEKVSTEHYRKDEIYIIVVHSRA